MKLKNWIKYVDSLNDVIIWGADDKEPLFEGSVFEIPWTIVDYRIGRINPEDADEPIYVSYIYESGRPKVVITINVIEE